MRVVAVVDPPPLDGVLRYVDAEHSFTFDVASPADLQERSGSSGMTSLSIGTLQIEIGIETGLVLFVWGFHPRAAWKMQAVGQPDPVVTSARLDATVPLQRGVSVPIAAVGEWTTAFDEATGWLHIAKDLAQVSGQQLLVATGVALGVTDGRLDSLWLQPIFE